MLISKAAEVTNVLAPVLTFSLFTIIAKVKNEQSLLVSQAFTSLTVLSLLGTPLVMFVQIVPMLMATVSSCSRIQEFLISDSNAQSHQSVRGGKSSSAQVLPIKPSEVKDQLAIGLTELDNDPVVFSVVNGTFGWTSGTAVLRNINLNVPKSMFVAVVGPVGSGKSTLLKALLGETSMAEGVIHTPSSQIAFCDQNAWITNITMRVNIVGPSEFDGPWYETVLHACALKDDLKALSEGAECLLGSRGVALSGGQKQRIVSRSNAQKLSQGTVLTLIGNSQSSVCKEKRSVV
jgi:ATP-binding cassette subfamily C (CFTR/MRP) protein 1